MFNDVEKIVVNNNTEEKANEIIVAADRSQCRTTHKRQDC